MSYPYRLFEAFGVELEYMIVDRDSLAVKPIADKVLGRGERSNGEISWSNELVNHVIELKTSAPAASLTALAHPFASNVRQINELLAPQRAMLMPGGAHPFMDPLSETVLWPRDNREIYALYDRIFDCRGHGWSNLQSTHINLPFADDREFGRLHAAVRLLLPIIPALSASTPLLDGRPTGLFDARLEAYRHNQRRVPSIAGKVIPEPVWSRRGYERTIFKRIDRDIAPYDPLGLLDHHFLNSRGAIARFDRGALEIRIIDNQESPRADLAVLETVVDALKSLVGEERSSYAEQKAWGVDELFKILLAVIRQGEHARIEDARYLGMFGLGPRAMSAGELWKGLCGREGPAGLGSLSSRILAALGGRSGLDDIRSVYAGLADCLAENEFFKPPA